MRTVALKPTNKLRSLTTALGPPLAGLLSFFLLVGVAGAYPGLGRATLSAAAGPPATPATAPGSAAQPAAHEAPGDVLFTDRFERQDSEKLGAGWAEVESESKVRIEAGGALFDTADDPYRPMIVGRFERQTEGGLVWEFDLEFRRTGPERTYSFWMQLGSKAEMNEEDPTGAGVAVNLVWGGPDQGLDTHEGFGYVARGAVIQMASFEGHQKVRVEVDLDSRTYTVSVAGKQAAGVPFERDVPLDTVRFFAHRMNWANFEERTLDEVVVLRTDNRSRTRIAADRALTD